LQTRQHPLRAAPRRIEFRCGLMTLACGCATEGTPVAASPIHPNL
jgi:hypothetical protein